jgi:hypothetical protein
MNNGAMKGGKMESKQKWEDLVDWTEPVSEADVWAALADATGRDSTESADGDLVEWL